jgi:hypothetical protein
VSEVPTIGRIVHYCLRLQDSVAINRRRSHAQAHMQEHRDNCNGVQIHVGNPVAEGQMFPMMITAINNGSVNGQVLLDGNDLFWATSVKEGEGPGTYNWPVRTIGYR